MPLAGPWRAVCFRQVWVTLCAGQGGTAGDSVRRAWSDSWQLTTQAAAAGLVLRRLEPFQAQQVPGYRPTGNRGSQSRTFHTRDGLIHVLKAGRPLCPDTVRRRLPGGPARLLLDGTPLPLAQYWLRRLPPDDNSLAAHVVRRLAAGAAPRPRVLVEHDGRCYGAGPAELSDAAAGGDLVCRSDGGGSPEEDSGAGQDVRVTYTVRDGEVGPTVADAPLRTRLTISGPADAAPEPRHALAAFGLVCKESRQEDGLELRAGCGSGWLPVARVRTGDTGSSSVTFDVDAITACWVQEDDWRHAVRADFTTDGTALRLLSVYPPSYSLDMSFWVSGGGPSDAPFSWCRLRRALRAALGELLVRLELIDEYEQPDSGRRACTVRLEYQDLSGPLSHGGVRHLHERVLPEVLRDALGVDTR
ncbi:Ferredoxin-fold anticodon-binding domain-containing protein 1 [Amphibalanus amphitrite]|uniref:Ferredoxin-fold anticodon-binding domain-containing protein 1 n=1 Tax=Amphibalanus amphitrite TaxID=1232801 RepID=A0A6A4VKW1_AMPAM|nr:Ferredoxin-fold anticodon-binding domain-containing protein 1 [Amphibalanus amphitrite]